MTPSLFIPLAVSNFGAASGTPRRKLKRTIAIRVKPGNDELRSHHARCLSLSIGSTWPLIDLAASEARNTASAAMSFGLIIALIDCAAIASARTSASDLPPIWARPAKTRSMRSP
jgi:hypothetical protein